MVKIKLILIIFCFSILASCATSPIKIPEFTHELKIYPSAGHISGMTESAMADHLVNDSQVYLAGNEIFGTLLGFLGAAIDKSRNDVDIENGNETLSIKFDQLLKDLVSSDLDQINQLKVKIIESEVDADIILLPSARLLVDKEGVASTQFRLTVRFVEPSTRKQRSKHYYFNLKEEYNLVGDESWSGKNASILKKHSRTAFIKLLAVLSNDISGNYKSLDDFSDSDFITYHMKTFVSLDLVILEKFDNYVLTTSHNNRKASFRSFMIYPVDLLRKKN